MRTHRHVLAAAGLGLLSLSFLLGGLTHAGVDVPLGVTTIDEPTIVPAAIVELVIAAWFAASAAAALAGRPELRALVRMSLRVGIGGVLLGMLALALGRGTRTELNDVFHVVVLAVMLVLWERTSGRRGWRGARCRVVD
jgi:hypothetical protein